MSRLADPVGKYARAVVSGKIKAGRPVKFACQRHLRDLKEGVKRGLRFDAAKAVRAIEFFRDMLVLEDGTPFTLQPFQAFIVGSLFGWYKGDTRRFRDAYVESGKGSGKTPLAAGIGLYGLIADGEPAPEVYAAAVTREQAKISYRDATRMVEASPDLNALIEVQVGSLSIPSQSAVFRPVSSEHRGLDGLRVHIGIIDELHEHPSGMVVDKIRAGTKRRKNALVFRITNSGFDRTSVCWHEHEFSLRVLEGITENDSWFAYVCSLDPGDDWRDEGCWIKANPGTDAGLPPRSYLREQVASAVGMPSKENIVRRLNFCEWTEQAQRWLDMDAWDGCDGALDKDVMRSLPCFAGLDAASTQDLAALVLVFGPDEEGAFGVSARFWCPEETLSAAAVGRSEQDKLMLRQWADQGHITLTPGNVTDYDLMEEEILAELANRQLERLAFDRWNVTQLITHVKDKLGEKRTIDYAQSFQGMSAPAKELEKLVAAKKLKHGGNPVLRWMASNVALRHGPDQQIKPDRERSREKIDGIVALVMALGVSMREPPKTASIYETQGLTVV